MDKIDEITKKQVNSSIIKIFVYLFLFLYIILTLPKLYTIATISYQIAYGLIFIVLLFVTVVAIRIEVNVIKYYNKYIKKKKE